jgi:hypothetical protein
MRLGPADVLQSPLKVSRSPDSPVEIVLSLNGGRTSGTAVNSRQEPLANAAVVLVPNEPRRGRLDLYRQAYTDASGQFRISGIAPGDYKLFAWEDVPANAWQYPDFIKAYETRGAAVHLEESGSENRQLTVIPIGN